MEITNTEGFISYLEKTRQVTVKVIEVVPRDKMNWSYIPGKFTIGDLIRHIAAIERHVFAEVALGGKANYKGCGIEIADGYENIISYFTDMHAQSMSIFKSLRNDVLQKIIKTVDGREIEMRNFLRALVVHEIHHRAALCIYLNLLGIETPSILGLKEEEVIQLCK